jgi:hypothetical protein
MRAEPKRTCRRAPLAARRRGRFLRQIAHRVSRSRRRLLVALVPAEPAETSAQQFAQIHQVLS